MRDRAAGPTGGVPKSSRRDCRASTGGSQQRMPLIQTPVSEFVLQETSLKRFFRSITPKPLWRLGGTALRRTVGWPRYAGETSRARSRRKQEGFFEKFCRGKGLDIGYGGDLLCGNCVGWDYEKGDAQYLNGIEDTSFDFVYSSHCLEHMVDAQIALRHWWRVLKPGGYLILFVPHRDLYERKKILPSNWNPDHKRFFLVEKDDPPDTVGLVPMLQQALPDGEILYAKECAFGYRVNQDGYPMGEYSIEAVVKKPRPGEALHG